MHTLMFEEVQSDNDDSDSEPAGGSQCGSMGLDSGEVVVSSFAGTPTHISCQSTDGTPRGVSAQRSRADGGRRSRGLPLTDALLTPVPTEAQEASRRVARALPRPVQTTPACAARTLSRTFCLPRPPPGSAGGGGADGAPRGPGGTACGVPNSTGHSPAAPEPRACTPTPPVSPTQCAVSPTRIPRATISRSSRSPGSGAPRRPRAHTAPRPRRHDDASAREPAAVGNGRYSPPSAADSQGCSEDAEALNPLTPKQLNMRRPPSASAAEAAAAAASTPAAPGELFVAARIASTAQWHGDLDEALSVCSLSALPYPTPSMRTAATTSERFGTAASSTKQLTLQSTIAISPRGSGLRHGPQSPVTRSPMFA